MGCESGKAKYRVVLSWCSDAVTHMWRFVRRLRVKKWLRHQDRKLQLVPDAAWQSCWACLRGGVLQLYRDQKSSENRNQQHSDIGLLTTTVQLR